MTAHVLVFPFVLFPRQAQPQVEPPKDETVVEAA